MVDILWWSRGSILLEFGRRGERLDILRWQIEKGGGTNTKVLVVLRSGCCCCFSPCSFNRNNINLYSRRVKKKEREDRNGERAAGELGTNYHGPLISL